MSATVQIKIDPDNDECPACHVKTKDVILARQGMFFRAQCGAFICECGCHYVPQSMVAALKKRAESNLILPGDK